MFQNSYFFVIFGFELWRNRIGRDYLADYMTDVILDIDPIVGDFIILFYGDLYNGLSTDMYNQYLWPLWLYKHLMIFYGKKSLYFRLRFWSFSLEVNFIRLYKIGSGHYRLSKIEIWKSKSKKLEKKWKYGLCMFIKETDCWTNSRNVFKNCFYFKLYIIFDL